MKRSGEEARGFTGVTVNPVIASIRELLEDRLGEVVFDLTLSRGGTTRMSLGEPATGEP